MAKRDDPNVIDGFASVQALKRASARKQGGVKVKIHESADEDAGAAKVASAKAAAAADASAALSPARASANVVVPQKRLVICYSCGYSHTVSGRMQNSYCPKCKTKLITEDVTVGGKHTEDILTIGNVTVTADAEFSDGLTITGQRVVLDGDVTPVVSITASEALEMRSNAKFRGESIHNITGRVIVPAGNNVKLDSPFTCTELEISGALHADVSVENSAHIMPGGLLEGSFRGPSLIVQDGGGLIGSVQVGVQVGV